MRAVQLNDKTVTTDKVMDEREAVATREAYLCRERNGKTLALVASESDQQFFIIHG